MEATQRVESKCPICKVVDKFIVPKTGMLARSKGKSIEDAFPNIHIDRRKQLADHVCPGCRRKQNA